MNKPRKIGNLTLPSSEQMYHLAMARSRQIINNIKMDSHPDWVIKKMKKELDEFHYHEVLDRTHVLLSTWDNYINDHPVVVASDELRKKSEEIMELIGEFYQLIPNIEEENESK